MHGVIIIQGLEQYHLGKEAFYEGSNWLFNNPRRTLAIVINLLSIYSICLTRYECYQPKLGMQREIIDEIFMQLESNIIFLFMFKESLLPAS